MPFRPPLVACVVAAALLSSVSPAFATAAQATDSNLGAHQPTSISNLIIGPVDTVERTYSVDVKVEARYVVSFQVNYPETSSVLSSSVDGRTLPDVVSPVRNGAFAVFAYTRSFKLEPGRHSIAVQASSLPSQVGIFATLNDATAVRP